MEFFDAYLLLVRLQMRTAVGGELFLMISGHEYLFIPTAFRPFRTAVDRNENYFLSNSVLLCKEGTPHQPDNKQGSEKMVEGWRINVESCCSLTREQYDFIRWKLSVLAVSTRGLFDDPVLSTAQSLQAYYASEYHAQETAQHIKAYLQTIEQGAQVIVTLLPAQWERSQKDQLP